MTLEQKIPTWWRETTLGEVIIKVTERVDVSNLSLSDYISTENMIPDKWWVTNASNLPTIGKVTKFQKWDILFSNIRTYFKKLWFSDREWWASNDVLIFRCNDQIIDKRFLFFNLSRESFFEHTVKTSKWTKMPRWDKDAISKFNILLPTLPEQRVIAHIFSSFDAKIELLREQNQTLEKTAQTIFNEWFGRYSVESPGELPEGWTIKRLGDFIKVYRWFSYKWEYLVNDANTVMINLWSFKPNDEICNLKPYSWVYKDRYILKPWDIVIANTDITQDRVILWMAKIVPEIAWKEVIHTHHIFWVNFIQELSKYFLMYLTTSFEYRERVESFATGTTVLALPSDAIENLTFVYNEDVIRKFHETVAPIIQKKFDNNSQIQSLSKTRDNLLPRLMSGEVRVV